MNWRSLFENRWCAGWPWLLAVLSGLLLALAYPPFDLPGFAWVGLVPLVAGVWLFPPARRHEVWRLAGLGWVCGLGYFGGSLAWLATLTVPGWILLSCYVAVYPAVWTIFLGTVLRPPEADAEGKSPWLRSRFNLRICLLGAAAWTALEWLRGVVFTGFGWNGLGVAMHSNVPLIQIADFAGVGGISFLVVLANLMAVATLKRLALEIGRGARRPHYDFALTIGLIALAWTYGIRQMFDRPPETVDLSFAAVQANIPQTTRNDAGAEFDVLDAYLRHTETAIAMKPDLILWPESATPRPIFNDQHTWDTVKTLAEAHAGDLLIGTVHFSDSGDFNSVALLTAHGAEAQLYHKTHLVPFGEYVPLRQAFPLFAWVVGDLVPDDFDAGPGPAVLELSSKPVKVGPLICFEDTLGNLARQFVLRGAQMFAVVTNDGWFLESAGSRQHVNQAVFRCAENKIPMIRAANTGVTCLIDRFGVVREELRSASGNTFIEGVLFNKVQVPVAPVPTFYARHGEVFSFACIGLTLLVAGVHAGKRLRRKDSTCPAPPETKL